jgi:hypothetical protein
MKPRLFFPALSLIALTILSACSSSATPSPAAAALPTNTATQVAASPSAAEGLATSTVPPTPIQALATSRGPELEATDPTTVSLASGQLQLVEFFRFT